MWEGSGNVNALDVLRALGREPEVLDAWITEVGRARGGDPRLDRAIEDTLALHTGRTTDQVRKDIERDKILTADLAKEYGLIDEVLASRKASAED